MICIQNKKIYGPGPQGDGITCCEPEEFLIKDCVIDLSQCDLDSIDEALGITWGAGGRVEHCLIRGAGKLILCGSGDADKKSVEWGKTVTFNECIFENFG